MFKSLGLLSSVTLCAGRGQDSSIIGLEKCKRVYERLTKVAASFLRYTKWGEEFENVHQGEGVLGRRF